jgi:hypothetical protein
MRFTTIQAPLILIVLFLLEGCANVVAPTGGAKDVTPPRLLSVNPADSQLNARITKIDLRFDEFIVLNNPASEITVSPIMPFPLNVTAAKKTVTIHIPDSLLQQNTTYRISFGNAIQDLHENNSFTGFDYIFSTGTFFDSLQLNGFIINAATGLRDTGAVVVLYDARKPDTSVVREKPSYAVRANQAGIFTFKGLPDKVFRVFALQDKNNNLVYDGPPEMIAFLDSVVRPSNRNLTPIQLNIFKELDTTTVATAAEGKIRGGGVSTQKQVQADFSYDVRVDTTDTRKRSQEITRPLEIVFSSRVSDINAGRINLAYDSSGTSVESAITVEKDTSGKKVKISTNWKENTLYTLRLLKNFAKDTSGHDAPPGKFIFRSKREEDYAKLHVHLPSKYLGEDFVFVLINGNDTVYQRPVKDTMIHFSRLQPGNYTLNIIADKNRNRKWDTGNLLEKQQPEVVIPYSNTINLKPGWENMIDFEPVSREKRQTATSPGKR